MSRLRPRRCSPCPPRNPTHEQWPLTLQANGAIAAWQEAVISAETGGLRIATLHVDVGDKVSKGQLLAELAPESVRADLRKQEAAVASARASLAQAKANADRARSVKNSGAVSEQQINEYLIAEQTAQASLDSALAALDAQRITLAHTRVVAVDSGVIFSRTALLGKVVSSGDELFRMVRQGKVEWRAELNAQQVAQVKPGQTAQLTLPNGKEVEGEVRVAAPTLSTDTSRAYVYVSLPAQSGAQAGMYASGTLKVGKQDALTVPQSAVVLRDGRSYVFEIGADNKVIKHAVTTGRSQDDRVEIVKGLETKANIVLSGGAFLSDGDLISVGKDAQSGKGQS